MRARSSARTNTTSSSLTPAGASGSIAATTSIGAQPARGWPDVALLQISEPGESPEPHQRRLAVGIDLGTTHSLVATVRSGVAEVIADAEDRPLLPSIVRYYKDGRAEVGYEARAAQADDPSNTIVSV